VVGHRAAKCLCAVPIRRVATGVVTIGDAQVVIVAHVALIAIADHSHWRHLVVAGQRPPGARMVEGVVCPGDCVVAARAVGHRECRARGGVRGIVGLLPIGQMAPGIPAIGGLDIQRVVAAHMALRALRHLAGRSHLVRIRQRETRRAVVEYPV
jgi:hypothetical protein